MFELKVIERGPVWAPPQDRSSRFGGPVYVHAPETRKPLLWLVPLAGDKGRDLYLVNATGEALELVHGDPGGFMTVDDQVVTAQSKGGYTYRDVPAGAAVRIDEYDYILDSDWMVSISGEVHSARLGRLCFSAGPERGSLPETVLLWDSGEPGKDVTCRKC